MGIVRHEIAVWDGSAVFPIRYDILDDAVEIFRS